MQDQAASVRDGGDWKMLERFGNALKKLGAEARAAFVAHVLLGEQIEIVAELLGRKPSWVMDSIRDAKARLSSCCAPDGRFALSIAELRDLLERLPVPELSPGSYERLFAVWDARARTR